MSVFLSSELSKDPVTLVTPAPQGFWLVTCPVTPLSPPVTPGSSEARLKTVSFQSQALAEVIPKPLKQKSPNTRTTEQEASSRAATPLNPAPQGYNGADKEQHQPQATGSLLYTQGAACFTAKGPTYLGWLITEPTEPQNRPGI